MKSLPSLLLAGALPLLGCRERNKAGEDVCDAELIYLQNELGGLHLTADSGEEDVKRLAWPEGTSIQLVLVAPDAEIQGQMHTTVERLRDQIQSSLSWWTDFPSLQASGVSLDGTVPIIEESAQDSFDCEAQQCVFVSVVSKDDSGVSEDDSDVLGITRNAATTYISYQDACSTGFVGITDVSIEIKLWTLIDYGDDGIVMKFILAHEIGHLIGLYHALDSYDQDGNSILMGSTVDLKDENLRSQPQRDEEGHWLTCLYTVETAVWNACFDDAELSSGERQSTARIWDSEASSFSGDLVLTPEPR